MNNCLDTYNYNIDKAIHYNYHNYFVYGLLLLFSFYLVYFGNKIVRPTLAIIGVSSSVLAQHSIVNFLINKDIVQGTINCNVYLLVNFIFAIFLAGLLCYFYKISIFILGSFSTGSISYLFMNIISNYQTIPQNTLYLTTGITGLFGGCLAIKYNEKLSIVITSMFGSFLGIFSFNKLINEPLDKYIYIYFPIYILFSIHGLYIQNNRDTRKKEKIRHLHEPIVYDSGTNYR